MRSIEAKSFFDQLPCLATIIHTKSYICCGVKLDEEESVHPSQLKIVVSLQSGHSMLFSNFNAITGSQTITHAGACS